VELVRPYYLCSHCHQGQFPFAAELDVENQDLSPGVRRMLAVVGQAAPFDQGREQMKLLAGLEVTTKAVERTAEAIGEDIRRRDREQIQQAMQLDLPGVLGKPIPILLCANGWHRSAGNQGGARRKQAGRRARPYSRSEIGMRFHPNYP